MLTPAPERKILRRMDYISDQKGIMRRYFREQEGWKSHLDRAGNFISVVLQNNETNHIVVLGSGWLLDFPIEKILQSVARITLVDVHFPAQVLRKAEKLKNVECLPADITGGYIQAVYNQVKLNKLTFTIPGGITAPRISPEKGKLILSLNILNQLDILLIDYIQKEAHCSEDLIIKFRKLLQESHVQMIMEHPFILMTDYREILINNQGKTLQEKDLIFTELPEGELTREWEWHFDTHQLYNAHANTIMKVRSVFSKGPQKL
jgi:hypothetical protein